MFGDHSRVQTWDCGMIRIVPPEKRLSFNKLLTFTSACPVAVCFARARISASVFANVFPFGIRLREPNIEMPVRMQNSSNVC